MGTMGHVAQSTDPMAKTITVNNIQLLTRSKRDSHSSWRTKGAKETGEPSEPITWDDSWFLDGDNSSVLVVNVYQKQHITKDRLIATLTYTIGELLQKLNDGGFEETLGKNDGFDLPITIKFSLTTEPREAGDAGDRQAADAITQATGALGPLESTPQAVQLGSAVDAGTTIISEAKTFETTWGVLLKRMALFNKIVADIATIHPYTSLAWSVISAANQLLVNQSIRDGRIIRLAGTMSDAFSFVHDAEPLKEIKAHIKTIKLLIQQVTECGYFITEYVKQKSFWIRVAMYTISDIDARIFSYESKLRELKTAFLEQVTLQTSVTVVRMMNALEQTAENIDLNDLPYARGARHAEEKGCLLGTRETLIREICDVLNNPAEDAPRICLLTGVAGSGKSAVAHSIARLYEEQKRLGSSYCFSSADVARRNPENLFSTIALDLSNHNVQYKSALWRIVKDDRALRTSTSPVEQLKRLIIEPSEHLHVVGPLVIVIDALDESGGPASRKQLMQAITLQIDQNAVPKNLRFLITTRPENDILVAFSHASHLAHRQMSDIPDQIVDNDIEKFVRHSLYQIPELESSWPNGEWYRVLVHHSHHLFQWARTACDFVQGGYYGLDPGERLDLLLKGDNDQSLDRLYQTILETILGKDPMLDVVRHRFHYVMGIILSLHEPLSLASLGALFGDSLKAREIIKPLGSLLDGVLDEEKPIRLLHTSFRDFLLDEKRSLKFHVPVLPQHSLSIGQALLACMRRMLKFNMCDLRDSRLRNTEVPDLGRRINEAIPPYLSYSARYWMSHLQYTKCSLELLAEVTQFFKKFFPYWIEVISLLSFPSPSSIILSALKTCTILQTWAKDHEIATLSLEAFEFIQTFSPVLRVSTPHLYLSAMAQTPSNSPLHSLWVDHLQNHISVTSGHPPTWPAQVHALEGHTGSVQSAAYSPDGKHIVSGSSDKTIRVWDSTTGQAVGSPFQGHTDFIQSVAYSPDGKHIVSGSRDMTIRVWDATIGQVVTGPFLGHTHYVRSVAYSPDGKHIVSGSWDKTIRVWDATTGQAIADPFQGHTDYIESVTYSPDGKHVVSGSLDNTIRVWDASTGQVVAGPFQGHTKSIQSVAYSPNGRHIVSGSKDNTIRIWDATTGSIIAGPFQGHTDCIESVAYSPDGRHIVSGAWDNTIRVWDASTGQAVIGLFQGHTDSVKSVAYSPDGRHIVSSSRENIIRVWDITTSQAITGSFQGHTNSIVSIAYSPDGKHIVSGSWDNTIRVWDASTGQTIAGPFQGHTAFVQSVAYSPDGRYIVSGSRDKTIRVCDTTTVGQAAMAGLVLRGHTDYVESVAYSPDGKHIASGSWDKTIIIWNAITGQAVAGPLQGHTHYIKSVAYSPDGKHIVSGSWDNTIRVWESTTGQTKASPFKGHKDSIKSVTFSPDGRHIVSAASDRTIRVWDAITGQAVAGPFQGHRDVIQSVAYSPDGMHIVSGSRDESIIVWNAATGHIVAGPFQGHTHVVSCVAYSPDGAYIASASWDYTIKVWKIQDLFHFHTMYINDGWIHISKDALFGWIAPWNRSNFCLPLHSVVMASEKSYQVQTDFSLVGESWISCWK